MKKIIISIDKNLIENLLQLLKICILEALKKKERRIYTKADGTLITDTDKNIHDIISKRLLALYPEIPIVSEEGSFNEDSFLQKVYWLIDPIDGTTSFVKGENSYTINIALIKNGFPCLGIIANPPTKTIWYGLDNKAFIIKNNIKHKLTTKFLNKKNIRIITSKNLDHDTKEFTKKFIGARIIRLSSSIKFCKLAGGDADIYPRLQSISKWDIAAGDAILRAAGGLLVNDQGKPYNYNTSSSKTGKFFAISNSSLLDTLTCALV